MNKPSKTLWVGGKYPVNSSKPVNPSWINNLYKLAQDHMTPASASTQQTSATSPVNVASK